MTCHHLSVQLRVTEEDKSAWEAKESELEQKIEENNDKILKLENYWLEAQALCKTVNEQLTETQAQYEVLDKKYNKAKKLLKDYQQKWVCPKLHSTVEELSAVEFRCLFCKMLLEMCTIKNTF